MITHKVSVNEAGQRLDRFLRKRFPAVSLSLIFSWLRKRKVRCNGKLAKGPEKLEEGDILCIYEKIQDSSPPTQGWTAHSASSFTPLTVVARLDGFIVVEKPAGLASQPGSGILLGASLVEQVWLQEGISRDGWKPALAHRLDQDTSGLVVVGMEAASLRNLAQTWRERRVHKEYLALVQGCPAEPQGKIEIQLERKDSARGAKMQAGAGQSASTSYRVLQSFGAWSLVSIILHTGRMHQIRAHFAHLGHPLAGDGRYGDFAANRILRKEADLRRLFLHANFLRLPWQGQELEFRSNLPPELQKVVQYFKV